MRYCETCEFLAWEGYEYPESYCSVGVSEDDEKFDEDSKGCGCRYNIRTLCKWHKENEYSEYVRSLGYDDFFLMPTMDYTDENKAILEQHRELMRHAIGMDSQRCYVRHGKKFYRPYRNYFGTSDQTPDYPYWERMVDAGLARKKAVPNGINYYVTRRGMDWLGMYDGVTIYNTK